MSQGRTGTQQRGHKFEFPDGAVILLQHSRHRVCIHAPLMRGSESVLWQFPHLSKSSNFFNEALVLGKSVIFNWQIS